MTLLCNDNNPFKKNTFTLQNDHLRGYKGDFYAAALLSQDLSNPLLANAKILNIVSSPSMHHMYTCTCSGTVRVDG